MILRINGRDESVRGNRLTDIFEQFSLDPGQVAVELNGTIIHRHQFGETTCVAGDVVEIVRLVGGG
jgi:thiamine biosynthesis protein ThiS